MFESPRYRVVFLFVPEMSSTSFVIKMCETRAYKPQKKPPMACPTPPFSLSLTMATRVMTQQTMDTRLVIPEIMGTIIIMMKKLLLRSDVVYDASKA